MAVPADDPSFKFLQRVADGHSLLTEYATDDEWQIAGALKARGLIDVTGIITGTVRLTLTNAGRSALAIGTKA